eukprot:gene4896-6660_t
MVAPAWPANHAVSRAGGMALIPINAKLHAREAAWISENAGATFAFVDDDSRASLYAVMEDLPPALQMLSVESADYRTLQHDDGGKGVVV